MVGGEHGYLDPLRSGGGGWGTWCEVTATNQQQKTLNAINECCVGVSTETVLQIDNFYTVEKRIFKLTFRTVVLIRQSGLHSDEGLQSDTSVHELFSLRCKTYQFVRQNTLFHVNCEGSGWSFFLARS